MNRNTTTAMGTSYIVDRPMIDHRSVDYANRYRKMSDARRRDVFGPMLPMRPEGEVGLLKGVGVSAIGLLAIGLAATALSSFGSSPAPRVSPAPPLQSTIAGEQP